MATRLESLIEEKEALEAQLVQIQTMLRTIEDYAAQEVSATEAGGDPAPSEG